jgi:hypothetical protein
MNLPYAVIFPIPEGKKALEDINMQAGPFSVTTPGEHPVLSSSFSEGS